MKFCTGKCAQEKVLCLGCSNPLQRHQLYLTVWQAEVVLIWPPRLCGLNATAGGVVRSWNSLLRASAQQATFCSRAHKERKQHSGSQTSHMQAKLMWKELLIGINYTMSMTFHSSQEENKYIQEKSGGAMALLSQ